MYIAQRNITLNGVDYKQGDPVPIDAAPERRMKMLADRGWLKPAPPEERKEEIVTQPPQLQEGDIKIPISIPGPDGNRLTQEMSAEEIQQVFDLLSTSVRELEEVVQQLTDLNILAVIDAIDPRKTAKELYAAQAKKLLSEGKQGGTEGTTEGATNPPATTENEAPSNPPEQNQEEATQGTDVQNEESTGTTETGGAGWTDENGGKGGDA